MKKVVLFAIIIGVSLSIFLFTNYNLKEKKSDINVKKVYFMQIGAYKNYENVVNITRTLPSYVVEKENDLYHVYVGISENEKNVQKIKEFYHAFGNNIYIRDKLINNENFLKKLEAYDYMIASASNKDTLVTINKEVLKTYEGVLNDN